MYIHLNKTTHITSLHNNIRIIEAEDEDLGESDEMLIIRYHQHVGRIYFQRLQDIVKVGFFPKRLYVFNRQLCSACVYSKAFKNPWKGKPS